MAVTLKTVDYAALPEGELVAQARAGVREAFAALMQRGNQRLFRIARSVVRDEGEAEDVLQEAYLRAFAALPSFRGESSVFTWLTRIVLNEAHDRLRKRRPTVELDALEQAQSDPGRILLFPGASDDPERDAALAQTRRLLERAVDALPEAFRLVFVMREVEGLTIEETAQALSVKPETVKTRLFRARRQLREALDEQLASALTGAFPFLGARCERITSAVLARLPRA
ncbi:RNA polymerase sigma factor [Phenylobacterium soli]|uniref:RNA polymerase sigma factor n=1 Tax=Phenylobacterium soli TaxID=2170551 RepID=A0A328AIM6_9CAUL|nr:RNA polymerase sigma factor [Phenylobacterium soli]RAK54355.1 RNA polymerase sigma factor [Phenylobacterium soli]